MTLNPRSVEAQTLLANSLVGRVRDQMTDSAAADLARAEGLVDQALAAASRNAFAHLVKGRCLVIFPAGGASTVPKPWSKRAVDPEWKNANVIHLGQLIAVNAIGLPDPLESFAEFCQLAQPYCRLEIC